MMFRVLIILFNILYTLQWCKYTTISDSSLNGINEVDFSPDGQYIAVASGSGQKVVVYNFFTLSPVWSQTYSGNMNSVKFSRLGNYMAVGTTGSDTVTVYSVPGFAVYATFSAFNVSAETVYEVDFSPDDTKVLACGTNNYVSVVAFGSGTNVYNPGTWKVAVESGTGKPIWSCKFSDDASTIAVACVGCTNNVQFLSATNGAQTAKAAPNPPTGSQNVDWKTGSNTIAYSGTTGDKNLYQITSNTSAQYFSTGGGSGQNVLAVSYAHDSTFIAIGLKSGVTTTFYVLNVSSPTTGTIIFAQSYSSSINSVRVSDDSQYIAVPASSRSIDIFRVNCNSCPPGFYYNVTYCRMCSIDIVGCSLCKNSTYCFACFLGYYVQPTTNLCVQCQVSLPGCTLCSNKTVCLQCSQQYYLVSNKCTSCSQLTPNCEQCWTNNGQCTKCSHQYYLTSTNTCVSCKNSIANCMHCYLAYNSSSATNSILYCGQCAQGYYASQQTCVACSANCLSCDNSNVCYSCAQEYKLSGGTCSLCGIAHCLACNDAATTCFECNPTTTNTSANVCTPCTSPCVTCSTSVTTCTSCPVGYYLNGTACSKCVGCSVCNTATGMCLSCPVGMYLNSSNNCTYCLNVSSHCALCTATACTACERNYYLVNGTCAPIVGIPYCQTYQKNSTAICEHCIPSYYLNAANTTCVACPLQCSVCDSSGVCYSCNLGYYYNSGNNTCLSCVSPCRTCNAGTSTSCLSCGNDYYLVGTTCTACTTIPNCYKCLAANSCQSCYPGYYLLANNTCGACTAPCMTCITSASNCLSCTLGYFYTANSCTRCPSFCSQCTSLTNCLSCVAGFAVNSTTANSFTCVPCSSYFPNCNDCTATQCTECYPYYSLNSTSNTCNSCNITNCLHCDNSNLCHMCKLGLFPASDKLSCVSCSSSIPNCEQCSNTSTLTCNKCVVGYYSNTSTLCSKCMVGCKDCTTSTVCNVCQGNFILNSNICKTCNNIVYGCSTCNSTYGCIECAIGYYLVSGSSCGECRTAMEGCGACNASNYCLACDNGYFLNTTTNNCQVCSSTVGCATCNPTTLVCTGCMSGYYLDTANSSICTLCSVMDTHCQYCNISTCLFCESGFYLPTLPSTTCTPCTSFHPSCIICNSSVCLQCETGYSYNSTTHVCVLCSLNGCEVCSENGTVCLSCQNTYYMLANGQCANCQAIDFGCIQCASVNQCLLCKTGYYLAANGSCILCTSKYIGCQSCSVSVCNQCKSNFITNVTSPTKQCVTCTSVLPGCDLCLSTTQCLSCQSGYYIDNSLQCQSCTTLSQCLICSDNSTCVFCTVGYYLLNSKCLQCSSAISGCFSCVSASLCLTCSGSFKMNNGKCDPVTSVSLPKTYPSLKIITEYVNATNLKVTLFTIGSQFMKIQQNWQSVTVLQLLPPASYGNPSTLTIQKVEWGKNKPLNSIVFYTNNPLGELSAKGSTMPVIGQFSRRRLLSNMLIVAESQNEQEQHKIYKVNSQQYQKLEESQQFNSNSDILESTNKEQITNQQQVTNKQEQNQNINIKYNKRLLQISLSELNINLNFNMRSSAISQLLPSLDTNNQDLFIQYKLNNPQFYKSVLLKDKDSYYYWIFGISVIAILCALYLIKICWTVPRTNDTGEIIPHIILMKVPAMVIYPSYGAYISYCYGFSLIDIPIFNEYFSDKLTDSADSSPASFQMFYNNLNLASTYLFPLLIYIALMIPLSIFTFYKQYSIKKSNSNRKKQKVKNYKDLTGNQVYVSIMDIPEDRISKFKSFLYNIFIAGLSFNSCINIIGMSMNPTETISVNGVFYILGILVYTVILIDAIRSYREQVNKFNKVRIIIKSTFMALMFWSPIALFAAMAILDIAISVYQYKVKIKEWVVPISWLISQILCIVAYASLIFLSNMLVGIIIASLCIVLVVLFDAYLHYKEYTEFEKIKDLRRMEKDNSSENNLSIQGFIPDKKQILDSRVHDLYFESSNDRQSKIEKSYKITSSERVDKLDSKDSNNSPINKTKYKNSTKYSNSDVKKQSNLKYKSIGSQKIKKLNLEEDDGQFVVAALKRN